MPLLKYHTTEPPASSLLCCATKRVSVRALSLLEERLS
jgi:hypothetical protein